MPLARTKRSRLISTLFIAATFGLTLVATGCSADQAKRAGSEIAKSDRPDIIVNVSLDGQGQVTKVVTTAPDGSNPKETTAKKHKASATATDEQKVKFIVTSPDAKLGAEGSNLRLVLLPKEAGNREDPVNFTFPLKPNTDTGQGALGNRIYSPLDAGVYRLDLRPPNPPDESTKEAWQRLTDGKGAPKYADTGFTIKITG